MVLIRKFINAIELEGCIVMSQIFSHLTHSKYRADIDGLRAVAVLSVVGFHAFPEVIHGGFIGVDIFFVISGFLISSIIFSTLESSRFSIADFYTRRIRRIFPALITVMLASLTFGWFALLADEYMQLGKHIAGGAGFVSNFILKRESGYFDNAAELKPMLHLWSLAIEEQFYVFWPLLMAFVYARRWNFFYITVAIAIASFSVNLFLVGSNPSSAFYFPVSRFWELMIGGVLAYGSLHYPEINSRYQNIQSLTGSLLLTAGLYLINKGSEFPGWWAVLPTAGAFLLISAGPDAWINRHILSQKIMVWFGLISYPLYLWHWPLLSFVAIVDGHQRPEVRVSIVLVSVLLAWITYRFIESPLRFGGDKRLPIVLVLLLFITGLLGYSCAVNKGYERQGLINKEKSDFLNYFDNKLPGWKYFKRENIYEKYREKCDFYNIEMYRAGKATQVPIDKIDADCYTKNSDTEKSLFIWGDSHASQLYYGIHQNVPKNWQVLQVTSAGCPPALLSGHESAANYCDKSNTFALDAIKSQRPDIVIVAQNLGHDVAQMSLISAELESRGIKNIIFTGPTPHWTSDLPRIILRQLWKDTPQRTFTGVDTKVLEANRMLKSKFISSPSRRFVSIIDYFCDEKGCLTRIGSDKKYGITSWDYGHLTPVASDAFARDVLVPLLVVPEDDVSGKHASP